ncbi:MAG: adenosylmethionine decarboxylase [Desulfurococcales archaeon]|nr:adenosylmethionine decarboxylase [Desulfurococcales archaeon]
MEDIVIGRHVYGNLYGIDPEILWDEDYLRSLILKAVEAAGATLLDLKSWRVEAGDKGGVSVVAIVLESHFSLHTWPSYKYASLDVYTCGETADPWKAFNVILDGLKPKFHVVHYADRSSMPMELVEKMAGEPKDHQPSAKS